MSASVPSESADECFARSEGQAERFGKADHQTVVRRRHWAIPAAPLRSDWNSVGQGTDRLAHSPRWLPPRRSGKEYRSLLHQCARHGATLSDQKSKVQSVVLILKLSGLCNAHGEWGFPSSAVCSEEYEERNTRTGPVESGGFSLLPGTARCPVWPTGLHLGALAPSPHKGDR